VRVSEIGHPDGGHALGFRMPWGVADWVG
jgi:hypothetical protein